MEIKVPRSNISTVGTNIATLRNTMTYIDKGFCGITLDIYALGNKAIAILKAAAIAPKEFKTQE